MAINYGSLQATLTPRGVVSGKVQNATRAFVKDYDLLDNKPKVNGVELSGDKSLDDLGIEIPEIVANPGDTTENLTSIGIDGVNYNIQGSGGSAVTSVNGKTGDVNLDAEDVGALPDDTPIPSELADLSEDSTHRTVTDTEKTAWNAKADISDLPTVNNSTITIQKNNQNVDSFTLNQDSNKSINISVPTKTSDLQNDNSFITNTVNNLANYYLKTQTYTQTEVDALIQAAVNGRFQKVNTLPASGEPNVIYLVPKTTPETSNACDEYIWQDNAWELIGSTEIDLSDYVTDEDLATALQDYLTTSAFATAIANYYTKTEVGTLLDNKVDKIPGKGLSTYDYDATAKAIVDSVTANLATKVDKVSGKGLSTNDYDNTAKGIVDGVTNALAGKANISEMSVTDGTGADADKTTIQLKSGTSATVLKTHQDISGKADKVSGATNGNLAGLDANGNLTDSGVAKTDIDDMQDELSTDSATATGNPINFSTLSAQNAESTIIDLEPIQDLHGYDKPWVGGAGKNKAKPKNYTTDSYDGTTYPTLGEGAYILDDVTLSAGTYTVSIKLLSSPSANRSIQIRGNDTEIYSYDNLSTLNLNQVYSFTFTLTENTVINAREWGTGGNSYKIQIQIESGSTATSFEPYSNICPISGRTEIGILGCGKNLLPVTLESTTSYGVTFTVDDNGVITVSGTPTGNSRVIISSRIPLKSSMGSITLSGIQNTTNIIWNTFILYDSNDIVVATLISGTTYTKEPITFDISQYTNTEYGVLGVKRQSDNVTTSGKIYPQIELGSSATPYEPYTKSTDLTISLGQTVYGGTLDVENGVLVVDKGYAEFDGSNDENWGIGGSTYKYIRNDDIVAKIYSHSVVADIITNRLEAVTFNNMYNNSGVNGVAINDSGKIFIRVDGYDDLTNYKTWLSNNPIQCVYPLANPITIQLAPHQISLLSSINNISTTGDKITLTYRDGKVATLGDLLEVEKKIPSATSQHNYSTEEQVVGTWIDGKPLYEKTFEFGAISQGSSLYITCGLSNVKAIVSINGMIYRTNSQSPAPFIIPGNYSTYTVTIREYSLTTDKLWIQAGNDISGINGGCITLQYTKTTA